MKVLQSYLRNATLPSFYFYCVLLVIVGTFLLSSYIYWLLPQRLETKVLYYFTVSDIESENDKKFVPEKRNIPSEKYSLISTENFYMHNNIQRFVSELMLGPQNIYAKNIIPKHVQYEKMIVGKDKNTIYFLFNTLENVNAPITIQIANEIQEWIFFNINNYFPQISNIIILFDKKMITST